MLDNDTLNELIRHANLHSFQIGMRLGFAAAGGALIGVSSDSFWGTVWLVVGVFLLVGGGGSFVTYISFALNAYRYVQELTRMTLAAATRETAPPPSRPPVTGLDLPMREPVRELPRSQGSAVLETEGFPFVRDPQVRGTSYRIQP